MSYTTEWGSTDRVLGMAQLMAFGKLRPPFSGSVQAIDPATLGRAQILMIEQADTMAKLALMRQMVLDGTATPEDLDGLDLTTQDGDQLGSGREIAESVQSGPHGAEIGPVGDLYLGICHYIRSALETARKTDQTTQTPPIVPPGTELPGLGWPLPSSPPSGWPQGLPWPGGGGGDVLVPPELPSSWWDDLPWFKQSIASGAPVLAIVVTVLGVAGIAAAAYYGIEKERAGVKIEAERAFAQWQAHMQIQIAKLKIAAGQTVEAPPFVSRAAEIERAQSSPWLIGGVGVLVGGLLLGAASLGHQELKRRRKNPCSSSSKPNPKRRASSRRQKCRIDGTDVKVEVRKLRSGFRAYYIGPTKRVPIVIPEVRTYDEAFQAACRQLRAAKRRARRRRNPTVAGTKRTQNVKRKKTMIRNPKRSKRTTKEAWIRRQMRKGRSRKQAQSDWAFRRRMMSARRRRS